MDEPTSRTEDDQSARDAKVSQVTEHERLPLKVRQSAQNRRRERSVSSEEPSPQLILPKLVSRKDAAPRTIDRARSGEPELPPTPVELGLSAPPERPRGLASSSSPRGSKISSGSRRRRTRSGGPVTSSPLKPKARPPVRADAERGEPSADDTQEALGTERAEDVRDEVQEAPESEAEEAQQQDVEDSTELQEQRSTLQSLRKQVEQLRQDNRQLQEAIDAEDVSEETLSMLRQSTVGNSLLKQPQTANASSSAYLTLFTPANLQLSSRTQTKLVNDRTKIIHNLQIQAPAPWLPSSLSCVFKVVVDAENVQIEHVELKDAMMAVTRRTKSTTPEAYRWAQARSEHPLHRLDVNGMVWGTGRWFNAAVERARVFRWIDLKYNRLPPDVNAQKGEKDQWLTREICTELARHLDSTQHSAIDVDLTVTPGGRRFRKRLMLNWQINIDWAGGLTSDIQISTSGIPAKAEPGLKTIFCALIPRAGVKGAFQNIWNLMHTDAEEFKFNTAKNGKRKRGKD